MNPQALVQTVHQAGGPLTAAIWKPVGGGCIHQAGRLGDDAPIFVKLNTLDQLANFEAEAEGLRALAASGAVRVPEVLALGSFEDSRAFIALEWIDLVPRDAAADHALGLALARLHQRPAPSCVPRYQFGWPGPNFIGASPQSNKVHEDWPVFFREQRLRPQLERLAESAAACWPLDGLLQASDRILKTHHPKPSLLHGDLWGGNASAAARNSQPVLFDPAVYVGDAETDLAFSRMFGGFSQAFYTAYHELQPAGPGHETRARLYNLYHLLNHANLFGGHYINEAHTAVERLVRMQG